MELHDDLNVWTIDTVIKIVKEHEFEPGIFDYKSALNATGDEKHKKEHQDSIRRTVCSMANTDGGFILFGILDRKEEVISSEKRITGIPSQGDLRKNFGDKIADIQPEVYFETVPRVLLLPNKPNRGIFVVRIPKSQRRPHMVSSIGVYYRRGENGTAIRMNHYEVRDLMMYTEERLRKVILFRLEISVFRRVVSEMLRQKDYNLAILASLYRLDVSSYNVLLADICGFLPPSLLKDMLDVRILIEYVNKFMLEMEVIYKRYSIAGYIRRIILPSQTIKFKEILRNTLESLDKQCALCEKLLDETFGPLSE